MSADKPFDKFHSGRSKSDASVTASDKVGELKDMLKGKKEGGARGEEIPVTVKKDESLKARNRELVEADRGLLDEEIKVLETRLKETEKKVTDEKERYLRLLAEFENFRKRMEREQTESTKYATEKLLKEIFPVIDHLEMTLHHTSQPGAGKAREKPEEMTDREKAILEGVGLVLKQLEKSLEKFGLKQITGEGKPFNPHIQEAIGSVETTKEKAGTVIEVHRSGFLLHDRLVRPALVTVGQEPSKGKSSKELSEVQEPTEKKKFH